MGLFDRAPLVRAEIALYGPRRAPRCCTRRRGAGPSTRTPTASRSASGWPRSAPTSRRRPLAGLPRAAGRRGRRHGRRRGRSAAGGPGAARAAWACRARWRWSPGRGPAPRAWWPSCSRRAEGLVPRIAEAPDTAGPVKEIAALTLLVALAADAEPDDAPRARPRGRGRRGLVPRVGPPGGAAQRPRLRPRPRRGPPARDRTVAAARSLIAPGAYEPVKEVGRTPAGSAPATRPSRFGVRVNTDASRASASAASIRIARFSLGIRTTLVLRQAPTPPCRPPAPRSPGRRSRARPPRWRAS